MNKIKRYIAHSLHSTSRQACSMMVAISFAFMGTALTSCEREPKLYLHEGTNIDMDLPEIDLDLTVLWDYLFKYEVEYDWKAEWFYGWDDTDLKLWGPIGYSDPTAFNIRLTSPGTCRMVRTMRLLHTSSVVIP